jgi:CRP/FNR family cyclic AMP-dependent transcriptional regulator
MTEPTPHLETIKQNLAESDWRRFEACLVEKHFQPRELLFERGDASPSVYFIRTGRVRTFFLSSAGQEVTTGVWSTHYVLGLISSLSGARRVLSAEAIDQATVAAMSAKDLEEMMVELPKLALNVSRILAHTAATSVIRASIFLTEPVAVRLIETLLALGQLPDARQGDDVSEINKLSQEDIARMVNASRPWIAQAISELEQQGLIISRRLNITIPSLKNLAALLSSSDVHLFGADEGRPDSGPRAS